MRILDTDGKLLFTDVEKGLFVETTNEWTEFTMALPVEALNQPIQLEWLLLSDGNGPNGDGFFLDDVVID